MTRTRRIAVPLTCLAIFASLSGASYYGLRAYHRHLDSLPADTIAQPAINRGAAAVLLLSTPVRVTGVTTYLAPSQTVTPPANPDTSSQSFPVRPSGPVNRLDGTFDPATCTTHLRTVNSYEVLPANVAADRSSPSDPPLIDDLSPANVARLTSPSNKDNGISRAHLDTSGGVSTAARMIQAPDTWDRPVPLGDFPLLDSGLAAVGLGNPGDMCAFLARLARLTDTVTASAAGGSENSTLHIGAVRMSTEEAASTQAEAAAAGHRMTRAELRDTRAVRFGEYAHALVVTATTERGQLRVLRVEAGSRTATYTFTPETLAR